MSNYLGFKPTEEPDYYFVSYNNEDADRVGSIASQLSDAGMHLWYDCGIEYGENWEKTIALRIQKAQAVLLFFTKDILFKENSFVEKEYTLATQFFDRKVYVVMMDRIENKDVPYDKAFWWIDINKKQCISAYESQDVSGLVKKSRTRPVCA